MKAYILVVLVTIASCVHKIIQKDPALPNVRETPILSDSPDEPENTPTSQKDSLFKDVDQ